MSSEDQCNEQLSHAACSKEVDVTFLPLIYEIIRGLERDPHDPVQKNAQSQDVSQKVMEILRKLEEVREYIRGLPGIEYSKKEQKQQLQFLRNQLLMKRQLILKFRNMYSFDTLKY
ncbi:mediator of RNA polymerase II transcription subunit 9 [Planococcus citri]|uniref:mediator of RNA polymerase II transcription subunit 9 n=1 Tax=Planococcus citri TaxID=170843 RepID=UPI0031F7C51F